MKEPKYKIGDSVWIMSDNRPVEHRIEVVCTVWNETFYGIGKVEVPRPRKLKLYQVFLKHFYLNQKTLEVNKYAPEPKDYRLLSSSDLHPTKESLIKSL